MSKRRHNFGTKRFKEKSLFIFHARIALKSLILLFVRLIARGARIGKTHTETHRHTRQIHRQNSTVTLAHARRGLTCTVTLAHARRGLILLKVIHGLLYRDPPPILYFAESSPVYVVSSPGEKEVTLCSLFVDREFSSHEEKRRNIERYNDNRSYNQLGKVVC